VPPHTHHTTHHTWETRCVDMWCVVRVVCGVLCVVCYVCVGCCVWCLCGVVCVWLVEVRELNKGPDSVRQV